MRAIGPAAANSLFSLSIEKGYLGGQLVYYVLVIMTGAALALGSQLPRQVWTDSRTWRTLLKVCHDQRTCCFGFEWMCHPPPPSQRHVLATNKFYPNYGISKNPTEKCGWFKLGRSGPTTLRGCLQLLADSFASGSLWNNFIVWNTELCNDWFHSCGRV